MKPENQDQENRDPITGEPGSHPLGTGLGSATGAATGAALGSIGGPVGMAAGAVIGAIAGAAAGHTIAEDFDPTVETTHWEANFRHQPYYNPNFEFEDYEPAYRLGYESYLANRTSSFKEAEPDLARSWEDRRGTSRLDWDSARDAIRAGWQRVEAPGANDGALL